jgi:hypothetical protein
MDPTRSTWTDERLDDLARNVEVGFTRVHEDLRSLAERMDRRFEAFDRRFDALQRLMTQLGGSMLVATLATLVSVLATRG